MADIRFYHTLARSPRDILPDLLEKARAKGQSIAVRAAHEEDVKNVDDALWTFSAESFLPHGTKETDLIRIGAGAAISAPILFLLPHAEEGVGADVTLCCRLFDGRNEAEVSAARASWKTMKEAGHNLTYWQQSESGVWEQKA